MLAKGPEAHTQHIGSGPAVMSFWVGTLIFLAIQAVVILGINFLAKPGSRGLPHILGSTAVFQCWLMWAIVYMAQMNPLVLPQLRE